MQLFEGALIQAIISARKGLPYVFDVAGLEPASEKFMGHFFEPIKTDVLVGIACEVSIGFFAGWEFDFEVVGELLVVLRFPVVGAEEGEEVVLEEVPFFVLV